MAQFSERSYISEFNVKPDASIGIRKTIEIAKDGTTVSKTYWRCVLAPHDPQVESVLGGEPYYLQLAQDAWKAVPVPSPEA